MKVLVTGSHRYRGSPRPIVQVLEAVHEKSPVGVLVEGGAAGIDTISRIWGLSKGIQVREYTADWTNFGTRAGSIRNQDMLDFEHFHRSCSCLNGVQHSLCDGPIDLGLAFPEPDYSVGTWDMLDRLQRAGIPHEVYPL